MLGRRQEVEGRQGGRVDCSNLAGAGTDCFKSQVWLTFLGINLANKR